MAVVMKGPSYLVVLDEVLQRRKGSIILGPERSRDIGAVSLPTDFIGHVLKDEFDNAENDDLVHVLLDLAGNTPLIVEVRRRWLRRLQPLECLEEEELR